jgi:hypothetical protein
MEHPQSRLAKVAVSAMIAANKAELNGQWERRDVILALTRSWKYGASLRVWAADRRYIKATDR